jgi:hypothetical protein
MAMVTRLAVRELWISFRLLAVLVAFVGVGAIVALLPAPLSILMPRLAIGLGAATLFAAAITAWSFAIERRSGRAGWLIARSVGRGTVLGGWFSAMASGTLVGLLCAGALGWLAASSVTLRLAPLAYVAPLTAVGAAALGAVAMGLLAGVLFPPLAAAVSAVGVGLALSMAALVVPEATAWLPGAAFVVLGGVAETAQGAGGAWRATGIGLVTAGMLLVLGRLAIERVEL